MVDDHCGNGSSGGGSLARRWHKSDPIGGPHRAWRRLILDHWPAFAQMARQSGRGSGTCQGRPARHAGRCRIRNLEIVGNPGDEQRCVRSNRSVPSGIVEHSNQLNAETCLAFIWRRALPSSGDGPCLHLATGADSSAANQGEAAPARAVWRAGSRPDQATEGETADSRIEAKARTWPGRGNVPKLRRRARTDPKRSWRIRR